MSFPISISDTNSRIIREYYDGIKLNRPYELCLKSFVTYNNIPNINEHNNEIYFVDTVTEMDNPKGIIISITTGTYELQELFDLITNNPQLNGSDTFFRLNKNTYKVEFQSKWYVGFTSANSMGRIFGFSENFFEPNVLHSSDIPVQLFTVNTIKVKCNLIKCNIDNLKQNENTLHEFPLSVDGGEKIIERPITLCYYPINTDNIFQLYIEIVDQDDNVIDFRGEKISIVLGFQPSINR